MTYAGRLDPAAEGKLLILAGEECKKKPEYNGLSKTYEAEILFGVSTDTYDLLGIPVLAPSGEIALARAGAFLDEQLGKHIQKYPPYSSKTVAGVQLHAHARAGSDVVMPTHEVELFTYSGLKLGVRTREEVLARVLEIAGMVQGDFRQEAIRAEWTKLAPAMPQDFHTISVTLKVGSGFYIRALAESIGRALDTGACLYSLVRTGIGE